MGLPKLCGFLAASVLPLILLVGSTEEAIRPNQTRKEYICSFPVVIRGTYPNPYKEGKPNNFNIIQVFKSPRKLGRKVKISTEKPCYYSEKYVKPVEWVIYGAEHNGEIVCQNTELMKNLHFESGPALAEIAINGCKQCSC